MKICPLNWKLNWKHFKNAFKNITFLYIWGVLCHLVPFLQFKKCDNTLLGVNKVAGFIQQVYYKQQSSIGVFTFLKWYKCYQNPQCITYCVFTLVFICDDVENCSWFYLFKTLILQIPRKRYGQEVDDDLSVCFVNLQLV